MDLTAYRRTIIAYKDAKPLYDEFAEYLQAVLRGLAGRIGAHPIIQGRAKSIESFAEKIVRPGKSYADPLAEITDFCGVRFIVHTMDEVERAERLLEDYFVIDRSNSEDKRGRLSSREFGYLSRHYIVQLKAPLPVDGFDAGPAFERMKGLKAELQVRTLAQHIWADTYHELGYKNEFQLPGRWEREFARIAAFLEACDQGFTEIKGDIVSMESNYGSYLSEDRLRSLAAELEILSDIQSDDASVLHRLLRAYLALSEWKKAEGLYRRMGEALGKRPQALRDAGVAICKAHIESGAVTDPAAYEEGRALILRAIEADPGDVESLCCMGGALRPIDPARSVTWYRKAFEADPANPYALGNYIDGELALSKDSNVLKYFLPLLGAAADRCLKQVSVRANIPWAFFDLGKFALYGGKPEEALDYYCLGAAASRSGWMVSSAAKGLEDLLASGARIDGAEIALNALKLAEAARTAPKASYVRRFPERGASPVLGKRVLVIAGNRPMSSGPAAAAFDSLRRKIASFEGTIVSREPVAEGEGSTALGSLVFWDGFLAGGGDPAGLRLIGFGGDGASAAEYRIALAMGAKVGIIKGSGSEADELLADRLWNAYAAANAGDGNEGNGALQALDLDNDDVDCFIR